MTDYVGNMFYVVLTNIPTLKLYVQKLKHTAKIVLVYALSSILLFSKGYFNESIFIGL